VEAEEEHGGGKGDRGLEGNVGAAAIGWSLSLCCASCPTSTPTYRLIHLSDAGAVARSNANTKNGRGK
jgi:hypothetical protein